MSIFPPNVNGHKICTKGSQKFQQKHRPIFPSFPVIWLWTLLKQDNMVKVCYFKSYSVCFRLFQSVGWIGDNFSNMNSIPLSISPYIFLHQYYLSMWYWSKHCEHHTWHQILIWIINFNSLVKTIGMNNWFWSCGCACSYIHNKDTMCHLLSIVILLFFCY